MSNKDAELSDKVDVDMSMDSVDDFSDDHNTTADTADDSGRSASTVKRTEDPDGLDWIVDFPSPIYNPAQFRRLPLDVIVRKCSRVRLRPLFLDTFTEQTPIRLPEPVDYLVCWANSVTAIGAVRRDAQAKRADVPLLVRFGGFWSDALPKLHLGCVVRVAECVRTLNRAGEPEPWVTGEGTRRVAELLDVGRPRACALATKWALVRRAAVRRSRGLVRQNRSVWLHERLAVRAQVQDVQHDELLLTGDDHWPLSLDKPPPDGLHVTLNWVSLDGERFVEVVNVGCSVILPVHLAYVERAGPVREDGHVFGWLDMDDYLGSSDQLHRPALPPMTTEEPSEHGQAEQKPQLPTNQVRPVADGGPAESKTPNHNKSYSWTEPDADGLSWYLDGPSPHIRGNLVPIEAARRLTSKVRIRPLHTNTFTEEGRHRLPTPVDYLVGWANPITAVGVVRAEADEDRVPLVVRLGGWWSEEAPRRLYMGCVVRVREVVRLVDRDRQPLKWVSNANRGRGNLLDLRIPKPCCYATEWAIVHKPEITRSLAIVTQAVAEEKRSSQRLAIKAEVRDIEYNETFVTIDEQWPLHQEQLPHVNMPVIVNWVHIENESHVMVSRPAILPAYLSPALDIHDVKTESYVPAWIDTSFATSRFRNA